MATVTPELSSVLRDSENDQGAAITARPNDNPPNIIQPAAVLGESAGRSASPSASTSSCASDRKVEDEDTGNDEDENEGDDDDDGERDRHGEGDDDEHEKEGKEDGGEQKENNRDNDDDDCVFLFERPCPSSADTGAETTTATPPAASSTSTSSAASSSFSAASASPSSHNKDEDAAEGDDATSTRQSQRDSPVSATSPASTAAPTTTNPSAASSTVPPPHRPQPRRTIQSDISHLFPTPVTYRPEDPAPVHIPNPMLAANGPPPSRKRTFSTAAVHGPMKIPYSNSVFGPAPPGTGPEFKGPYKRTKSDFSTPHNVLYESQTHPCVPPSFHTPAKQKKAATVTIPKSEDPADVDPEFKKTLYESQQTLSIACRNGRTSKLVAHRALQHFCSAYKQASKEGSKPVTFAMLDVSQGVVDRLLNRMKHGPQKFDPTRWNVPGIVFYMAAAEKYSFTTLLKEGLGWFREAFEEFGLNGATMDLVVANTSEGSELRVLAESMRV